MEKMIYLDNSATTPLCENAKKKISEAMEVFGNPSSLHSVGFEAEKLKENARDSIYKALGVRKLSGDRIIFTSGGTEANNLAIFGCIRSKPAFKGKKIVTTDSEHPSVLTPFKTLEQEGYRVEYLPTNGGKVDIEDVKKAVDKDTVFISVMAVNNETGAVYDIENIFKTAKSINPNITTHCDCVQGFMKIPFFPSKMHVDMCTISSHKIHGPKGCGALYVNADVIKTKRLTPIICGGGQENDYRSGTENMLGICGFGGACDFMRENLANNIKTTNEVREYAEEQLNAIVQINKPKAPAPHVLNFTLPAIKSETMLHFLSSEGIFVSSGSACSSNHAKKASHVLLAFGLSEKQADSSLRISFSEENTKEDVDALVSVLKKGIDTLARPN
ncbi:MAG: cysteine desulfurase [Clostridia bacterium]|nr:cysteine desulfurase [Clostridia bacterium]